MCTQNGHHSGLEVLMTVASCASSLLGPNRTLKCIVADDSDPEGSVLTSTAPDLLSNLDIDHPVGQLLNLTCQAHYKMYGTGCKTLVCMAGFLARAALHCLQMGIPVSVVCHCLEEGITICCQEVEKTAIVVDEDVYQKNIRIVSNSDASLCPFVGKVGSRFRTVNHQEIDNESDDVDDISWYFDAGSKTSAAPLSTHSQLVHVENVPAISAKHLVSQHKTIELNHPVTDMLSTEEDKEDEFAACFEENFLSQSSSKTWDQRKPVHRTPTETERPKKLDMTQESLEQLLTKKLEEKGSRKDKKLKIRSRHLGAVDFLPLDSNTHFMHRDLQSHKPSRRTNQYKEPLAEDAIPSALRRLSQGLSHGRCLEMQLACELFQHVLQERQDFLSLDKELVRTHTCLVSGLSSKHSCVANGVVVRVGADQLALIYQGKNKQRNIVLVNGDIAESFHHVGYKTSIDMSTVLYGASHGSSEVPKSWLEEVQKVILDFDIGIIVAKGVVDQDVVDFCLSVNCVVVEHQKYSTLQTLSDATGAGIITYLINSTHRDIGTVMSVELLEEPAFQSCKGGPILVKIDTPQPTWSVVLCSLARAELHDVEQHFWICLNRLKNALSTRKVLPGGGSPELTCIRCLRDVEVSRLPTSSLHPRHWLSSCINHFRPVVFSSLADSFEQYLLSTMVVSGEFTSLHHARAELDSLLEEREESTTSFQMLLDYKTTMKATSNADGIKESVHTIQPMEGEKCTKEDTRSELGNTERDQRIQRTGKDRQNVDIGEKCIPLRQRSPVLDESWSQNVDAGVQYEVLDCMCKLEAWKSAAALVQLVLRTDTEIINGPKDDFDRVL